MNIQNDFLQQYHPIARRTKSNVRASVQPDFQRSFDNYYSSLNDPNAGNVSNPMPSAPQNVKDAWTKTEQEIGKENLGVAPGGKLSHISGYMHIGLAQQGTRCSHRSDKTRKQLTVKSSAIEAKTEFIEIALHVCTATMISAKQKRF